MPAVAMGRESISYRQISSRGLLRKRYPHTSKAVIPECLFRESRRSKSGPPI